MTIHSSLSSSVFAPGILQVMDEFNSSNDALASFIVSVYVIGYAFGPLLIAPMSEIYGRSPLYFVCTTLFAIFSVACALAPTVSALIIFRLFAGLAGSCPLTAAAGTIADIIPYERRGRVMAVWGVGPLLGPIVGPIGE
jgi:MFS family permease